MPLLLVSGLQGLFQITLFLD